MKIAKGAPRNLQTGSKQAGPLGLMVAAPKLGMGRGS